MATTTATRSRNSTSAKRSANARAEARDEDGRFKSGSSGSSSTGSRARKKPTRGDLNRTGALLAAGAAGLAVGLAANVARKLAIQAPTLLSGEWDEALKAEHQLTLKVFDQIEATTEKNTTKRATLLMNLKHMLAKHAMEEENAV